jgi:opacity protein-like surface antigen
MPRRKPVIFAVVTGLTIAFPSPFALSGELKLSLYGGQSLTLDTDVDLDRSGGTDLTIRDVSFDDESFTSPFYYGARLSYWFGMVDQWGVMIDFTHAKLVADVDQQVAVSGTRKGTAVSGNELLSATFENFQISHGHNLLTLNGAYRWRSDKRINPYVGVGAGVAIPHVEVTVDGEETSDYQMTGPAFQGLVGLDVAFTRHLSAFGEYKLSYAMIDGDLEGGGSIKLDPITNHFIFGLSLNLPIR